MLNFLGCSRVRTTAYHPAANGMVERFHQQLKASIMAHGQSQHWVECLLLVLLGIRSTIKEDLRCCPAELVFGTTLRLPGELIASTSPDTTEDAANFVHRLRNFMRAIAPQPPRLQSRENFIDEQLENCSHIFVRCDRVRNPLEPPYEGPFPVVARGKKHFTIQRNGKNDIISLDRVKAASVDCPVSLVADSPPPPSEVQHSSAGVSPSCAPSTPVHVEPLTRTTRSGRRVHFPDRRVQPF